LRTAIDLRPDYASAYWQLGRLFSQLGDLVAAETNLRRALQIEVDSTEILYDLAVVLLAHGKAAEAMQLVLPKLQDTPPWPIKLLFSACASHTRFTRADTRIGAALTQALADPWAAPYQLSWPALSFVMLDPYISKAVHQASLSSPAPQAVQLDAETLRALS